MAKPVIKIGEGGQRLAVITPSLFCNYDCSYCRIKSKTRKSDEHELSEWRDALIRAGSPVIHLGGGEPTALKGFEDFILGYSGSVRMTTNLWKDPLKWAPGFWNKFEYITLSFHPEHTTFEKFAEKVAALVEMFKGKDDECPRMSCTIVAYPEFLDHIKSWVQTLTELGVNARGQYYNSQANDAARTYTSHELARLKELNIPMSSKVAGQEVYKEATVKQCDAGMYYTHINMRGGAKRCSRDNMTLGNIFDGTFRWFDSRRRCVTACTEACDMAFAKYDVVDTLKQGAQI